MKQVSSNIIPLFWIKKESPEVLLDGLAKLREAGIFECILEARPCPYYLTERWFDLLRTLLAEARRTGMRCWLFDDGHFPSGYGNGKISRCHRKKLLRCRVTELVGPGRYQVAVPLEKGETLFKAVFAPYAAPDGLIGEAALDVTGAVKKKSLTVEVPAGRYRLFFLEKTTSGGEDYTQKWVNMLSPEAVAEFIEVIYQRHYGELAEFFEDGTMAGFFSDEPRFGSLPTYESLPDGKSNRLPFSDELAAELSAMPPAFWPSLFHAAGAATPAYRAQFMDAVSRLYSKSFPQQIGDWCRAHQVEYIGHTIEDNGAHSRAGYGVGHFFRTMQGQDAAMIDSVLHQNLIGITEGVHETSFGRHDSAFFHWGLGKLASSAAHLMPDLHGRALCECFGANGWSCDLEWMKRLTDHFAVRGINGFVPHAFSNAPFPDPDCPPHFYARGHNPQWRYFPLWRTYCDRVSALLSGGVHLAGTLILYHAEAEWSGEQFTPFHLPGAELLKHQCDFDVVPLDILKNAEVKNGKITLNGEEFSLLIVPEHRFEAPEESATLARLTKAGLAVVPGRDALRAAQKIQPYPVHSASEALRVYRWQVGGEVRIFLVNEHPTEAADFAVPFAGSYWFDAVQNRRWRWRNAGTLAPGESLFLIIGAPVLKDLPEYPAGGFTPVAAQFTGRGERRKCTLTASPAPGKRVWLDCGMPEGVAELEWNGQNLGALFAPPYRFEVTGVLQKSNTFTLKITASVAPEKGGVFDRSLPHRVNGADYPKLVTLN